MSYVNCTEVSPLCPVQATTYGYYPNLGGNIFFAVWFGILGVIQVVLGCYYRSWTFLVALVIGTFMEMIGYVGRVEMHYNPWWEGMFEMQIVCLILAPSFIAAGIYLTLKHITLTLGPEHSRLKPNLFTWIFIGCDIGSILLQAAGGGIAASAGKTQQNLLNIGDDVMIAGIAFQVATMSVCGLLGLEFFIRVWRRGSGWSGLGKKAVYDTGNGRARDLRLVCTAETLAYVAILIRCIYRIPEMAGGWGSPLMQRENEFLVLDGMMVAISVLCLTAFHPALFLSSMRKGRNGVHAVP